MRTLLILLAGIILASPASAIKLSMIGQGAPKIAVYRQSDTTAVVYDARPEFGLDLSAMSKAARDATIRDNMVRVVRHTLEWGKMEPSDKPGLYDAAYLKEWDQLVSLCRVSGICLCVAVTGEPPGLPFGNMEVGRDRLTTFVADMAGRYPSITYWGFSQVPSMKDMSMETAGKTSADVLKSVYPAIKTANPSAQIICEAAHGQGFVGGMYAGGGQRYFDVMTVETTTASFAQDGKALRSLMSENGDELKPLWCQLSISEEGLDNALQSLFDANNSQHLYDKILAATVNPIGKWLGVNQPNAAITARPRNTVNVVVPTKTPMIPIGYDYKTVEGGIEVQRVVVDSLVPTVIQLRYAAEPQPAKPGAKPAPTNKRNPAPIIDPWDI